MPRRRRPRVGRSGRVVGVSAGGRRRRVLHVARRSGRLVHDRAYRRAMQSRTLLRALRRVNGDLRYVAIADDGGITFLHIGDEVITPWAIAVGGFQKDDFRAVWDLAQRLAPRPPGGVFVDVGANVGTTTLYAMRSGSFSRAVCIEPSPDNLAVLRLNLDANGLADRVVVVPAACGAEPGTAQLWLSPTSQGDHRVGTAGVGSGGRGGGAEVAVTTLDAALADADVDPAAVSLVWVDTQGLEADVLAGAGTTVAGGAPFAVELWPSQYARPGDLEALLGTVTRSFERFVDIHDGARRVRSIDELGSLCERLVASLGQTDVILVPPRP